MPATSTPGTGPPQADRPPVSRDARAGARGTGQPGRGAIRIGRIAGIPVGVQPLWLVIVGLITWSLGQEYFPSEVPGIDPAAAYALGLASALLLFAGIVAHEFGHALVARRHGVRIDEIDLWLLGGVARMRDEPPDSQAELRFALAGPLVTAVLAAAFGVALLLLGDARTWLRALVEYQCFVNAAILAFNLLPAFPLDGGRVLRSLLWARTGDRTRATRTAAGVGRWFGWLLVVLGLMALAAGAPAGIWTALIGGFLIVAGQAEAEHSRRRDALAGRRVADLMSSPADVLRGSSSVQDAVESGFARHLHRSFPVVDDAGRAIGLVTLADVRALPPADRPVVRVAEIARSDPDLFVAPGDAVDAVTDRPGFQHVGRAVVLDPDGTPAGVLSTSDVERLLLASELLEHRS